VRRLGLVGEGDEEGGVVDPVDKHPPKGGKVAHNVARAQRGAEVVHVELPRSVRRSCSRQPCTKRGVSP
jgi:hypothetical protein